MKKYKVAHLTSVHPRLDTRIFYKECISLSQKGYSVSLIVADGKGYELHTGVSILDVGITKGRLSRVIHVPQKIYDKALSINADIYHLHDPELIPIGLKLKKKGYKVIFDAHEDFPKQLANKKYINKYIRFSLSRIAKKYEEYALKKMSGIVAATPNICDKFLKINNNSIDINNFPRISFINQGENLDFMTRNNVCYIGGITIARGIQETLKSLEFTDEDFRLSLAGKFFDTNLEVTTKQSNTWGKVDFYGWLDHSEVSKVLETSFAGLVTLHPISNYLESLPVKMFEYMANGLPVIYSNIDYWDELIGSENCGISVDPYNPKEIANAINFLKRDKAKAKQMGENGRKLVLEKFNWGVEENKLFEFYEKLLST